MTDTIGRPIHAFVALGIGLVAVTLISAFTDRQIIAAVFAFVLLCSTGFSAYVLIDAFRDFRAIRMLGIDADSGLATWIYVVTESTRLTKQLLLIAVAVAATFYPPPKESREGLMVLTTTAFMYVALGFAFVSYISWWSRRRLGILEPAHEAEDEGGSI